MKMSAEEILIAYRQDPSKENMERIAELNDCTVREVGKFLKAAAEAPKEKKRPGRPKKNPENSKNPSKDITISDIKEKKDIKSESVERKLQAPRYLIPELVRSLTQEHIEKLEREIEYFEQAIAEKKLKRDELVDFLNGGFDYGQEDGIHREVSSEQA